MLKSPIALFLALAVLAPLSLAPASALAGGLKAPPEAVHLAQATRAAQKATPPANYSGQWWTHPAGCEYSRAGRPGEVVWFLTAVPKRASCPEFILQTPIDNAYRAPRMISG